MKIKLALILSGIMFLLFGLTFFAVEQTAEAEPPVAAPQAAMQISGPIVWNLEAVGADLFAVDTASTSQAWALSLEGQVYQYNGSNWQRLPRIGDAVIFAGDFVSNSEGWAVGYRTSLSAGQDGAIFRYNGSSWSVAQNTGTDHLLHIDMISSSVGWAVGEGVTLRYDGNNWTIATTSNVPDLTAISAVSNSELWGVGPDGVHRFNGQSWQLILADTGLNHIDMSATEGWAVGTQGEIIRYNGSSWAGVPSGTGNNLYHTEIRGPNDVWAVGDQGTVLQFNGSAWNPVASNTSQTLYSVDFGSGGSGWIVGTDSTLLEVSGTTLTDRSGQIIPPSLTTDALLDVTMLDQNNTWAVGGDVVGDSIILRHNGSDWQSFTNPTTQTLFAIDMLSANEGWAVGGNIYDDTSVILSYNGSQWLEASTPTTLTLLGLDMVAGNSGWAVGGNFLDQSGVIANYNGSSWSEFATFPAGSGSLHDVKMISLADGWAVGENNRLLRYNGAQWQPQALTPPAGTTYDLYSVDLTAANQGWAVGVSREVGGNEQALILSYNGSSWQPTPTSNGSLEGITLLDVFMVSSSEGWAIGSDGTILYYNGSSWNLTAMTPGLSLTGASLINSESGWLVGSGGSIFVSAFKSTTIFMPLVMRQSTPTPVPTPTSTPTPVPQVLYLKNFNSGTSGWPLTETFGEVGGDCESHQSSGEYRLDIFQFNVYPCIRPAPSSAEHRFASFETSARLRSGSDRGEYGIYVNGHGGSEYYLFRIRPDEGCRWEFIKRDDNHDSLKRHGGCDPAINRGSGTNRLRIDTVNDNGDTRVLFLINDVLIGEYVDSHPLHGRGTGVYATTRDNDSADIRFQYFEVRNR